MIEVSNKVLCLDFDGTIHAYSQGWKDGSVYDVPVPGAFEAIRTVQQEGWTVIVLTSREDHEPIRAWFERWNRHYGQVAGFMSYQMAPGMRVQEVWSEQFIIIPVITNKKVPAQFYIDDRAIRFTNWNDILRYIC